MNSILPKFTDHQWQLFPKAIAVARLQKFQGEETMYIFHRVQYQATTNFSNLEIL